jgi:mono/diheme cytochrome c family protein
MKRPWYRFLYVRSPLAKLLWALLGVLAMMALLLFQLVIETPRMEAQTLNWEGRSVQNGAAIYANNCSSCHGPDGKGLPGVAPALNSHYFFEGRLADLGFTGTLYDYVKLTVAAGRPNNRQSQWAQMMPTWSSRYGGPLRDDQVEDVTSFVLNWEADALTQTAETDPWQPFQNAPMTDIFTGQAVETAAPAESTGPRSPQQLFNVDMACAGCHNINLPQTDTEKGPVAPNMGNFHETAGTRVPGEDAVTYTHNSIVNPNAHTVEGYNPVMPANFGERMSPEEIDSLVQWILDPNREQ